MPLLSPISEQIASGARGQIMAGRFRHGQWLSPPAANEFDDSLAFGASPEIFEVFRPATRIIDQDAAALRITDEEQRLPQYRALHPPVKRLAEIVSHRMINENRPGRHDLEYEIATGRNAHRRDSRRFYHSTYQTHGLVV